MNFKELAEKLEQYPELKLRVEELLQIIENDNGEEILSANVAEQRVIDSLRGLGNEMLQNWGESTSNRVSEQFTQKLPTARKDIKKKVSWHTTFGIISLKEQIYRLPDGRKEFRPFLFATGIKNHSYSLPLERRVTDFGADVSFCTANNKLKEHYGI